MIAHLAIKNYALIKELQLDLPKGFTTITGETGAGKSILLGALGLVIGNRADTGVLADETKKCIVEAHFDLSQLGLQSFFENESLDYEPTSILRREILPSGKSRAFINDTPVKLNVLKSLGSRLVDVHSQHDSMLMTNPAFQLEMLDAIAKNEADLLPYKKAFAAWQNAKKERAILAEKLTQNQDTDYLAFLVEELEKAQLTSGEEERIEAELEVLRNAEEITENLAESLRELEDEFGILTRLHQAKKAIERVANYLPKGDEILARLQSAEIELQDLSGELQNEAENVNLDQSRLQDLEERFAMLQHLLTKHRVENSAALIEKFDELSTALDLATNGQKALAKKDEEINKLLLQAKEKATALHKSRQQTASVLEKEIAQYLKHLQLENAKLKVSVLMGETPLSTGFDEVQFLFSANPGSPLKPISKVASGGELSRVMLALKAILAKSHSLPSIIFDEIDTGISGKTAQRAAEILREMGHEMQVLAITHLPQLAALGAHQLKVEKKIEEGTTETGLHFLAPNAREEELARLLSGEEVTEAARLAAKELLAVHTKN